MIERWLPVPGYEGAYEVSDLGGVRSVIKEPRVLASSIDSKGYPRITLRGRSFRVHQLVCAAFHGPKPEGCEVGHVNGARKDARSSNLRWLTRSENNLDTVRHGRHVGAKHLSRGVGSGEANPSAKLTDAEVVAIRADAQAGLGGRRLARKYGISRSHAHRIVSGQNRGEAGDAQPSIPESL